MLTAFTAVMGLAGSALSHPTEVLRKHLTHGLGAEGQVCSLLSKDRRPEGGPSSNLTRPLAFCLIHVPCNQFTR